MSLEKMVDTLDAFLIAQGEANEKAVDFAKAVAEMYNVNPEKLDPEMIIDEAEKLHGGAFSVFGVSAVMIKATDVIKAATLDKDTMGNLPKDTVNAALNDCCKLLTFLEDLILTKATGLDNQPKDKL